MFNKVLIANRGEIAVRIMRACRELGMQTVAVFSDADRSGAARALCRRGLPARPAPSRESYLRGEKHHRYRLEKRGGWHPPGYGFLAERDDFAQACLDAGLVFIGPKPSAIAAMGDKAVARSRSPPPACR
jgi:acetyl/propionyl-CoA carboxylase alpha subunit